MQSTYLGLHHEASPVSHALDKVEDVHSSHITDALHLGHYGTKRSRTSHTSAGTVKDRETKNKREYKKDK